MNVLEHAAGIHEALATLEAEYLQTKARYLTAAHFGLDPERMTANEDENSVFVDGGLEIRAALHGDALEARFMNRDGEGWFVVSNWTDIVARIDTATSAWTAQVPA